MLKVHNRWDKIKESSESTNGGTRAFWGCHRSWLSFFVHCSTPALFYRADSAAVFINLQTKSRAIQTHWGIFVGTSDTGVKSNWRSTSQNPNWQSQVALLLLLFFVETHICFQPFYEENKSTHRCKCRCQTLRNSRFFCLFFCFTFCAIGFKNSVLEMLWMKDGGA